MTKRIILSLAMIALTIAGVTSATVAYFSDTAISTGNTFTMGTVEVEHIDGLPFLFENMIPGEQKESEIIIVENTGSMPIDLYVGQKATSGTGDFKDVVDYAINEVLGNGTFVKTWINWQHVSFLFSTWNKVGENIPTGEFRYYKVYVKPLDTMENEHQGDSAITDVFIHAVQAGYSAPSTEPWIYTP
ncbi:MAG: TasA family protein [Candidatus Beckwithbacteria bacterium]